MIHDGKMAELHGPELSIDGHSLSEEQHHEKKKQVMAQKTLNRNRQVRCCLCCYNGKCVRCSCVMNGKNCQNCLPSRNSLCSNLPPNASSTNINHPTSSETLVSSSSSSRLSEIGPVPQSDVNSSHFDFSDNTTATIPSDLPAFRRIISPRELLLITHSPNDFHSAVEFAYDKIVCWKSNLFKLPVGNLADQFVQKLAHLFDAYVKESVTEGIAIKKAMIFPALILQKPFLKSKPKDHLQCLERRLPLWDSYEGIVKLLKDGQSIQRHLSAPSRRKKRESKLAYTFAQLLTKGKVRDAIRLLSPDNQKGVLDSNYVFSEGPDKGKTVLQLLNEKHPKSCPPHSEALIDDSPEDDFHFTPPFIRKVVPALQVQMRYPGVVGVLVMVRSLFTCVNQLQPLVRRYVPAMLILQVCQHSLHAA